MKLIYNKSIKRLSHRYKLNDQLIKYGYTQNKYTQY